MSNIKAAFGTSNQAITCTLTSLASAASRQSAVIDNSANLFLDALVFVTLKTSASALAAVPYVDIFAYATADGGSNYTEGASGSDAAFTPVSPTNLKYVGSVSMPAVSTTYKAGPFSVAAAFGGILPEKWGLVFTNNTGQALDASVGSAIYQGVYNTVA